MLHDAARRWPWLSWAAWLEAMGVEDFAPAGSLTFDQYDQILQAALLGQGIALGRMTLATQYIRKKQLVTLFGRSSGHTEGLVLDDDEQHLLDVVDGRKVLYELVNTPPLASADNARILYAFFALGLIVAREPRQIKVQLKTDGGKHA